MLAHNRSSPVTADHADRPSVQSSTVAEVAAPPPTLTGLIPSIHPPALTWLLLKIGFRQLTEIGFKMRL